MCIYDVVSSIVEYRMLSKSVFYIYGFIVSHFFLKGNYS